MANDIISKRLIQVRKQRREILLNKNTEANKQLPALNNTIARLIKWNNIL